MSTTSTTTLDDDFIDFIIDNYNETKHGEWCNYVLFMTDTRTKVSSTT